MREEVERVEEDVGRGGGRERAEEVDEGEGREGPTHGKYVFIVFT